MGKFNRGACSVAFPIAMRWLAGEIMAPPRSFEREFGIPHEVIEQAFWKSEHSRKILSGYFGDMRKLADDLGLMNPIARRLWRTLGVDGPASRYRSEPERGHRRVA